MRRRVAYGHAGCYGPVVILARWSAPTRRRDCVIAKRILLFAALIAATGTDWADCPIKGGYASGATESKGRGTAKLTLTSVRRSVCAKVGYGGMAVIHFYGTTHGRAMPVG